MTHKRFLGRLGIAFLNLGFLLLAGGVTPDRAWSAERVYVSFGPIDLSLPISELETYAREGRIEPELGFYANYLTQEQLDRLQTLLLRRVNLTPVAVAQFLYSPTGEKLLEQIGEVIQTKSGQPGFYALRAALIQSAASPEGLTPLNVLKNYPTYGVRINSQRGFQVINQLSDQISRTEVASAAVEAQAVAEMSAQGQSPIDFSQMPDLRKPGLLRWTQQAITLNDVRRKRTFPVDIYLPQFATSRRAPLVVISHGLGSDRQTFRYLAQHLASYGFAVAVPEHPGSSARQLRALTTGLSSVVTPSREFIDRPLDIKYLLDQVGQQFPNQINVQQVGLIGQSFGGYTALAVAGASLNFAQMQQDCSNPENSLNLSLVLQCQALILPPVNYQLQDERIKAAIAINPFVSSIFGETGMNNIKIPLMMLAGTADTVTPALSEQVQPFTWLNNLNRYLVLLQQGTHFSTLQESNTVLPVPEQAMGPSPETAREYLQALSVAFLRTYVSQEPAYQSYLSADYAQFINQFSLPIRLVKALTPAQLTQTPDTSGETTEPTPSPSPIPIEPTSLPSPTP